MANIFKTTLKKDVIADIANNNVREIRFPITKFWATRLADEYNLDEKEFTFKTFDSLELSSPSNKDSEGATYTFEFIRTFVDGEEFVVEFKDDDEGENDCCPNVPNDEEVSVEVYTTEVDSVTTTEVEDIVPEIAPELPEIPEKDDTAEEIVAFNDNVNISNEDMFDLIKDWFDDERVLENFYEDENVFATNARQVIILPKGRILGSKRTLPVNNDVEVRVEFDMNKRIYFDSIPDFDNFEEEVLRTLSEVKKNNFVFVWRRNTGVFIDDDGRVYFGIRYSTRKSIGFNRRYNVQ
jgi:hypothetical protein